MGLMDDWKEGAKRAGVEGLADTVREPIVAKLCEEAGLKGKGKVARFMGSALQTKFGAGVFQHVLGHVLPLMEPLVPDNLKPLLTEAATELRIGGAKQALSPIINAIRAPVVNYLEKFVLSAPAAPGMLGSGTPGMASRVAAEAVAAKK